ncbi:MAG: sensor histidine kinase [Bacteroidetes bacterium]|nr:MAG: sensor histidine kinase [Bacteroidota bacterium]REK05796.1 MAG: sensor histidine kinase [Bacteroidota bacterium]REK31899.1 MAG: sensor histidine kinase [Bacteroidota bacterium]REK49964.1 MAG: sensor histidine kinase [Bacteroidota bacterium]
MRLLNITNRYYIAIALVLLVVSSAFLAYRVIYVMDMEVSEHLLYEKQEIEKQLSLQPDLQGFHFVIGDKIEISPIDKFTSFKVNLTDTMIYDEYEKKEVPYRKLTYEQLIDGEGYRISIRKRLAESENLIGGVTLTLILVAIDIIACFYFLNRWFSKRVWKPFYRALNGLKHFDLHKGEKLTFQRSRIDEFNTLSTELSKLTDKVARDYQNLKEFTENMSHETQTPLAVVRSKLEVLLQSDNLKEEQVNQILSALESVKRLSKMNKSLILLTRIENEQFADEQMIDLSKLVHSHLENMEMFILSKKLNLKTSITSGVFMNINAHLGDILISNLISNAIKHGKSGGDLLIMLDHEKLVIANHGPAPVISDDQIFERFKKGDQPDSIGLGLAIVKRICDHCFCEIHYEFKNELHTFTIEFSGDKVQLREEQAANV